MLPHIDIKTLSEYNERVRVEVITEHSWPLGIHFQLSRAVANRNASSALAIAMQVSVVNGKEYINKCPVPWQRSDSRKDRICVWIISNCTLTNTTGNPELGFRNPRQACMSHIANVSQSAFTEHILPVLNLHACILGLVQSQTQTRAYMTIRHWYFKSDALASTVLMPQ